MGLGDKLGNKGQDGAGRAKEAAGALTGNDELKREGKADQGAAAAKDALEDAKDAVTGAMDNLKDKFNKKN